MLNYLICERYIHTDYIYEILPQKIFSLLCIPHATCSDKCYIWRRSLQGVFSYALLVCLHGKPNIHTCCIFVTSLHYVQSHDSSQHLLARRHNHTRCICETSLNDQWCFSMFTLILKLRFEFKKSQRIDKAWLIEDEARPLSVPFLLRTSGKGTDVATPLGWISQSSWLD